MRLNERHQKDSHTHTYLYLEGSDCSENYIHVLWNISFFSSIRETLINSPSLKEPEISQKEICPDNVIFKKKKECQIIDNDTE